ncbi:MAG: type II secretion system protein [Vicinamibacteraceae bacterium]
MVLGGQGARHGGERGYAMAALLVSIAVMSIVMATALPAWQHMMQREREEEWIFRSRQYARALMLFQRKYPGAYPTSVEILIKQKFLRKKYKDPLSPDGEFRVVRAGELLPGQFPGTDPREPGSPRQEREQGGGGFGSAQFGQGQGRQIGQRSVGLGTSHVGRSDPGDASEGQDDRTEPFKPGEQLDTSAKFIPGGMVGVASKNTGESIKIFKGQDHYDKWVVTIQDAMPQFRAPGQQGTQPGQPPGGPGAGSQGPGQGSRPSGIGSPQGGVGPNQPSTQAPRSGLGSPRVQ